MCAVLVVRSKVRAHFGRVRDRLVAHDTHEVGKLELRWRRFHEPQSDFVLLLFLPLESLLSPNLLAFIVRKVHWYDDVLASQVVSER